MNVTTTPWDNQLLAQLPPAERKEWQAHLEPMQLSIGKLLFEAGSKRQYVYFPTTAIISVLSVAEDGDSAEVAVVGNEGVAGVAVFMGGESAPTRATVQCEGEGFRLKAKWVLEAFEREGAVRDLLLLYTQAFMAQVAQTVLCNRHHALDQQLCRWLLLSLDRLPSDKLKVTQQLIANLLGVRREGISEAASQLQKEGIIAYQRGHITVLDRTALEARTCECYGVVKKEYARLLTTAA
jgi:CRP-like cAMP-binding protein